MAISTPTTAGQVLTSAYVNNNINSGLVYVTSVTVGSAVSTVAVTGAFSATYDNYRITISGGVSSLSSDYSFQLTGVTTNVYQTYGYFIAPGTASITAYAPAATDKWLLGSMNATQYTSAFDVISPNLTKQKFMLNSAGSSTTLLYQFSGNCTSTSAVTGFSIIANTGTMTGGTITVYGYRKA